MVSPPNPQEAKPSKPRKLELGCVLTLTQRKVYAMNKRERRIVKRVYLKAMLHKQRDTLMERQHRAALIRQRSVAGRLLLQTDETDCDGYRSNGYTIIPATVMAFEYFRNNRHQHAEGACFVWIEEGAAVSPDVWEWASDPTRCELTSFEFEMMRPFDLNA